ncbi:MAG: RES family NAD+ phosphorylase [Gemmatimonadota bacterium]
MWRYIPRDADPLHAGYIVEAGGRWNRKRRYGCLYTALSMEGAVAEYDKAVGAWGIDEPRDLVSLEVRVAPVRDLTTEMAKWALGFRIDELTADGEQPLEHCRRLADQTLARGYNAILAPSAARAGELNLMIYLRGDLTLRHGPDRRALNYGYDRLTEQDVDKPDLF